MAEVFVQFDELLVAPDGTVYQAQACGGEAADGTDRWEGWVEFLPVGGGAPLRSRRETTQPNRTDTEYWATGLSHVYLKGTLERTLAPLPAAAPPPRQPRQAPAAVFEAPAPSSVLPLEPTTPAVLNPFSVYRKSEKVLRSQLGALSPWHLVNIVRAYGLSARDAEALTHTPQNELVELIVAAVKARSEA